MLLFEQTTGADVSFGRSSDQCLLVGTGQYHGLAGWDGHSRRCFRQAKSCDDALGKLPVRWAHLQVASVLCGREMAGRVEEIA